MSGENYRSASKSHDPGWNDPPKVTTPTGAVGTGPPRTALNKRVPFPLQRPASNVPSVTSLPAASPTPMPLTPKSNAAGSDDATVANSPATHAQLPDREAMLLQIRSVFDEFVRYLEEPRQADVQKRVNLIYEKWTENAFPEGLEKHIYDLSNALKEKDDIRANVVHRSIVCDYGSKCALWAPVLRQLIFALQKQNEKEEPKSEEN